MKILLIGNCSVDHIIHVDTLPDPKPTSLFATKHYHAVGGSGIGKALNMNKLGIEFLFGTRFADDEAGKKVRSLLEEENIDYLVDVDPLSTVTHTNLMDKHGDRISIFTSNGSPEEIIELEKYKSLANQADIIILNISNFCKEFIPLIKKSKAEVWTDLHDYDGHNEYHQDFIDVADVIFMSSDKLRSSYEEVAENLLEDAKFVVVTHGKDGVNYYDSSKKLRRSIIDGFNQVDTNGAGDSFFTGFLYGYLKGSSIEDCLTYGSIVGGLTVESEKLFSDQLSKEVIEKIKKDLE